MQSRPGDFSCNFSCSLYNKGKKLFLGVRDMITKLDRYRGCLVGMAAGDALGRPVEKKTYEEIRESYGLDGLRGYDMMNGKAEVTAYTQIAAFTCNGLLLALTQGRSQGLTRYLTLGLTEWATSQRYHRYPQKPKTWLSHMDSLRGRFCFDHRLPDTIARGAFGSVGRPANQFSSPATLTAAIASGLYYDPARMPREDIGKLSAQSVALTQGDNLAMLSGAVLGYLIAFIASEPGKSLSQQVTDAAKAVSAQFAAFPEAAKLEKLVAMVVQKASAPNMPPQKVMEKMDCREAHTVLLGGIFSALIAQGDFDTALITAVNHSGCSAGTAAVAGAILGAYLGQKALPAFYLDGLEAAAPLAQIAKDLVHSGSGHKLQIFDDDWDKKYIQGEPVEEHGWAEA